MEQWASNRDVRLSPFNARERELGAVFFEAAGWERPVLVRVQRAAARRVRRPGHAARPPSGSRAGGRRSSTPSTSRCATGSGMVDLSAFAIFDVTGPGALRLPRSGSCVNQMDVPVGRVVYTPLLNEAGGILADLTIMRLAHDQFRVVTGGGMGMRDKKWFTDHLPGRRLGPAPRRDLRLDDDRAVGAAGPRRPGRGHRRRRLATPASRSGPAEDGRHRRRPDARLADLATSASSAGRSTCRWSRALRLWDALWEAGQAARHRARRDRRVRDDRAGSRRATAPTAPSWSSTSTSSRPGMARPTVKDADFVGKAAYLEQRSRPAGRGPVHADRRRPRPRRAGVKRYMLGREPILTAGRRAARRREGPALVRDQRRLRPVGRQAPADGLPAARAGGRRARSSPSSTSASATR